MNEREKFINEMLPSYMRSFGMSEDDERIVELKEDIGFIYDSIANGTYVRDIGDSVDYDLKLEKKYCGYKKIWKIAGKIIFLFFISLLLAPLIWKGMFGICVIIWIACFSLSCLTGHGCD